MVLAIRSLPVPLSPWIRIVVASLAATFFTKFMSSDALGGDCDDLVIASVAANLATQRLDFGAQAGSLQRILNGDP